MSPRAFLALPRRERQFCEIFLVAESLKQRAHLESQQEHQRETQEAQSFDARTNAWHAEVQQRWRKATGH